MDERDLVEQPESLLVTDPIAPVAPNPALAANLTIQHLGIEIANKAVELASVQARVALVLQAFEHLHIDTWTRQNVHEPSMATGEPLVFYGPIVIPSEEHEMLSRFLAAVEGLR